MWYDSNFRKIGTPPNQISISSMSPVPVSCLIEKELIKNSGMVETFDQDQTAIVQETVFDASMVTLDIAADADMTVGSLATIFLNVATTPVDYQAEFK